MKSVSAMVCAVIGIFAGGKAHGACGTETVSGVVTNYCETYVSWAGIGANGSPAWNEGVVYATFTDDQAWFWDNSSAKNQTLAILLAAKSSEQKVQVRWVSAGAGIGNKKITSILILP